MMTRNPFRFGLRSCRLTLLGLLLPWLAGGCGSSAPVRETGSVSGKVHLAGKPLASGVVILEDAKRGVSASALVQDGSFAFADPVEVGSYLVAIQPPPQPPPHEMPATPPPAVKLPPQVRTPASSGLTATVGKGNNALDFQVK